MMLLLILFSVKAAIIEVDEPPIELSKVRIMLESCDDLIYSPNKSSDTTLNSLITMGIPSDKISSFLLKLQYSNSAKLLVHTFCITIQSVNETDKRKVTRYTYYLKGTKNSNGTYTIERRKLISFTIVKSIITETRKKYFLWWEFSKTVKIEWRPLTSAELSGINSEIAKASESHINNFPK
ncbi:hypothetical protein TRFO_03159 [Tritrichomonas foetus]|uniref:Uncharacterized protein n=1 Tax=Tritrichomonas foetus TaxID=1144522 RepID=A0A1J4KWP5_9EUKA|nr:hypothetical protein TRFO_03159 [Tritrichomonas foetus]|eukprot:OHT14126.1 hypothetical protein TRFO_03159 [Tritrichomonas foetus]